MLDGALELTVDSIVGVTTEESGASKWELLKSLK
jgi:hypothetical protein